MFHDGGRLKSKACSITVYAMKCADLPPHMSHTKEAHRVCAVVEGEDEPLIVRAIIRSIIDELVMYYPMASGVSASYTLQLALHAYYNAGIAGSGMVKAHDTSGIINNIVQTSTTSLCVF
jgi:hypothetical protein